MVYYTDVIKQIKRNLDKKICDKSWQIKVNSHDIDKHKRDKYGYERNERTKINL
jgi:hypothetical protein